MKDIVRQIIEAISDPVPAGGCDPVLNEGHARPRELLIPVTLYDELVYQVVEVGGPEDRDVVDQAAVSALESATKRGGDYVVQASGQVLQGIERVLDHIEDTQPQFKHQVHQLYVDVGIARPVSPEELARVVATGRKYWFQLKGQKYVFDSEVTRGVREVRRAQREHCRVRNAMKDGLRVVAS